MQYLRLRLQVAPIQAFPLISYAPRIFFRQLSTAASRTDKT